MQITNVKILLVNQERLKAYAQFVIDGCFVVKNVRVVKVMENLIVSMPSRKLKDESWEDVAHPITKDCRKQVVDTVLAAYHKESQTPARA